MVLGVTLVMLNVPLLTLTPRLAELTELHLQMR